MIQFIKDLAAVCAALLPYEEPVYDFGSYQVQGQEVVADLRPIFPGKTYVWCDMRLDPDGDPIVHESRSAIVGLSDRDIHSTLWNRRTEDNR